MPLEVWHHYVRGRVEVIRRWNDNESVCKDAMGHRWLLRDELMVAKEVAS